MVEWLSYGLELILAVIGGLFTILGGIIAYKYEKRDKQTTEEQQDTEGWYVGAVEYAQEIHQIQENCKKRSIPQHSETQWKMEIIADNLSSHCTTGELLDIEETTLALAEETAEKCMEVVQETATMHGNRINSKIERANESAEELEQSAKKQL
jgi:hypothetical protein